MKKLLAWWNEFLRNVLSASTKVSFYRSARDRRVSEAAGHLAVLAALVWLLPFAISFFLGIRHGLTVFMDGFRSTVPPGTVFEMKDHVLSSNLAAPIVVRTDEAALIFNAASSTLELGPEEVGLVVGAESLTQKSAPNRSETVTYGEVPDFRITKEGAEEWIARYAKLGVFMVSLVALAGATFALFVSTGLSAAFYALVLWFVLRLMKRHWHYRNAFVVALYASTVPILAGAILALANIDAGVIPSALHWILLAFIAFDVYRSGAVPTANQGADHDQRKEASGDDRPGSEERSA